MIIRPATYEDWSGIHPIYRTVMDAGETYAAPPGETSDHARASWSAQHVVVAVDENDTVLGSAKMGPNRPGRGAHVATASFIVDPAKRGYGTGRALGEYMIDWARREGYRSVQFNAVVETNDAAVRLWRSLGFEVIGTVPGAFDHPSHGLVGLHVMYRRL